MIELINEIAEYLIPQREAKERMVKLMGGRVLEFKIDRMLDESEARGVSQGMARGIIKTLLKYGVLNEGIIQALQEEMELDKAQAEEYLERYYRQEL